LTQDGETLHSITTLVRKDAGKAAVILQPKRAVSFMEKAISFNHTFVLAKYQLEEPFPFQSSSD